MKKRSKKASGAALLTSLVLLLYGCGLLGTAHTSNRDEQITAGPPLTSSVDWHWPGGSSSIEAWLRQAGDTQTKVLVLDDTIILGQLNQYRPYQTRSSPTAHPALLESRDRLQRAVGENVRILLVSDQYALAAMERIKHHLRTGSKSLYGTLSRDLTTVLRGVIPDTGSYR